ncbi:MAG: hypothetical protein PHF35_01400 [Candidatus Moranbacteria bacterium]|nr:hypothetical protein [Candidatus Moranbacteria bacterium]
MFQFKNAGPNALTPNIPNQVAPSPPAKIRTFKEDLENFQKTGKTAGDEEISVPMKESRSTAQENKPAIQEKPEEKPMAETSLFNQAKSELPPDSPFQSVPAPPPSSAIAGNNELPLSQDNASSQSFFGEKPAATPKREDLDNIDISGDKPKKSHAGLLLFIFLVMLGAGACYYWFFIGNNTVSLFGYTIGKTISLESINPEPESEQAQTPETSSTTTDAPEAQNQNFRNLVVDMGGNESQPIAAAAKRFAADFLASAEDGQLVEIKVSGKDGQAIGKDDFVSGSKITVPDAVFSKLSEDYSLFARKEEDVVRIGLVFKTVTSSGLAEEMKRWEPTIASNLENLYVDRPSIPASTTFSSTQYKSADIRYFNFSSPKDTSLDYSVISNFVIIGTSKDTMRAILDYMSAK